VPKVCYIPKKFNTDHLALITLTNQIVTSYQAQGFDLTLRQVYYQMVARDIIPNTQQSYKRIGDIINDARLAGLIDWLAIVDRTRNVRENSHWSDPSDIVRSAAQSFAYDKWAKQEMRPEVWVEKDALVGVVGSICRELDIPYFSCRGYTSSSEMWIGAQRLARHVKNGQTPLILHLGDHDPSGKDMTRDILDRIQLFMGGTEVRRLALNMNQIEEYDPPPNFAKITDSRAKGYIEEFGDESWELDALEPSIITGLIREAVEGVRDQDLWEAACEEEEEARKVLTAASDNWEMVAEHITDNYLE
jgi:hypothetical protein